MLKGKFLKKFTIIFTFILLLLINSTSNASGSESTLYIKNKTKPEHLYVIDQNKLSNAESTMIATLQGLTSNSSSQIYTINKNHPSYKIWLQDLKKNYGVKYEIVDSPWYLLKKFKPYINGYILYDSKDPKDPSINNACSLASLKNSIAVDSSIENDVKSHGIDNLVFDCRNTDKYWAYKNLWNLGLNHSTVIELNPKRSSALRDYAIMTKSLIFYEDDKKDTSLRDKVFSSMDKNSICLGWGPSEFSNVKVASKYGVNLVPADFSYNLTVLSSFPSPVLKQKSYKSSVKLSSAPTHYVTFIMSDGDNQQWNLGSNFSSPKWYGSEYRGKINLGWSISPSLYYLSPTVLKMYYNSASNGVNSDYFLVSPSGMGYIYPSKFDSKSLNLQIKELNSYMKKVDQKYVSVLDDGAFYRKDIWNKYTSKPNIDGIFYLDYKRQDNYKGKIIWSNKKPVVSCRDLLWSGLEDEDSLVDNIENYVNMGYTNPKYENAYTMVYVHVWSKTVEDVANVVDRLNKNPSIKVVPPNVFMESIKENVIH